MDVAHSTFGPAYDYSFRYFRLKPTSLKTEAASFRRGLEMCDI